MPVTKGEESRNFLSQSQPLFIAWLDSWGRAKTSKNTGTIFLTEVRHYIDCLCWHWLSDGTDDVRTAASVISLLGKWLTRERIRPAGMGAEVEHRQQVLAPTQQRRRGYLTSPSGVSEGQSIPH